MPKMKHMLPPPDPLYTTSVMDHIRCKTVLTFKLQNNSTRMMVVQSQRNLEAIMEQKLKLKLMHLKLTQLPKPNPGVIALLLTPRPSFVDLLSINYSYLTYGGIQT